MRKIGLISFLVIVICMACIPAYAEVSDYDIKYGKEGIIKAKLIEDFSQSTVSGIYRNAIIEEKDGMIVFDDDGKGLCDTYNVTVPNALANKELLQQADYVGVKIKNLCDDEIYFGIQGTTNGVLYLMSPLLGEKDFILIDKQGFSYEIEFSSGPNVYERYAIIIPKDFEGYILVPTDALAKHGAIEVAVPLSNIETFDFGFHVSFGEFVADPPVASTFVDFNADDLFVYTGQIPEYVSDTTPTPAPTNTPSPTKVPTEKTKATEPKDTEDKQNDDGRFNPLYIIIPVAAVVLIVIVVLVIKKKMI